jgi:hypothetical protein
VAFAGRHLLDAGPRSTLSDVAPNRLYTVILGIRVGGLAYGIDSIELCWQRRTRCPVHSGVPQETAFRSRVIADWMVVIWSNAARSSPYVYENAWVSLKRCKLVQVYVSGFDTSRLPAVYRAQTLIPIADSEQILRVISDLMARDLIGGNVLASLGGSHHAPAPVSRPTKPPAMRRAPASDATEPVERLEINPDKALIGEYTSEQHISAGRAVVDPGVGAEFRSTEERLRLAREKLERLAEGLPPIPSNCEAELEKEAGQLVHRVPERPVRSHKSSHGRSGLWAVAM